jgi:hypothetical protein
MEYMTDAEREAAAYEEALRRQYAEQQGLDPTYGGAPDEILPWLIPEEEKVIPPYVPDYGDYPTNTRRYG